MGNKSREIPYFVEDENQLTNWEIDSYLIDRKNLFKYILKGGETLDIIELYARNNVSVTNFAKLLNELVEVYGALNIDDRTMLITTNVKQKIFIHRSKIFFPHLTKIWKVIPKNIKQ